MGNQINQNDKWVILVFSVAKSHRLQIQVAYHCQHLKHRELNGGGHNYFKLKFNQNVIYQVHRCVETSRGRRSILILFGQANWLLVDLTIH